MAETGKAIVVGVGPEAGLGAALCRKLATEGFHVYAAARTRESVDACAKSIGRRGGQVTPVVADATREEEVVRLFEIAEKGDDGAIEIVVYNAGNMVLGELHEMEVSRFEQAWRVGCLGGFLVGREAVRRMLPNERGTVIFTGATASLRGRANTGAFASAKAGLRAIAQSMARAYGPRGIHVAHVVVDGAIRGEKVLNAFPQIRERLGDEGMLDVEDLANAFWMLHCQPRTTWTHELDIRPYKEAF